MGPPWEGGVLIGEALCSWSDPSKCWELKAILPWLLAFLTHRLSIQFLPKGPVMLYCITLNSFIIDVTANFKYLFFFFCFFIFCLPSLNVSFLRALTLPVLSLNFSPFLRVGTLYIFIGWINLQLTLLIAFISFNVFAYIFYTW